MLCVTVFFAGLGSIIQKAGARFKSDEKALALVAKARQAIGGDAAIASVRSISIAGQTTRTLKVDGVEKSETGETEIALMLPDKMMKMVKIGRGDGTIDGDRQQMKQIEVVVVGNGDKTPREVTVTTDGGNATSGGEKRIVIKKGDGNEQVYTGAEADKIIAADAMGANAGATRRIIIRRPDGTTQELTGDEAEKVIARDGNGKVSVFTTKDGKTSVSNDHKLMIDRVGGGDMAAHHEAMKHNEMLRLTLSLLMTAPEGLDVNYQLGGESDVDGTACNIVVAEFGGQSFKIFLGKSSNLPVMMSYKGMRLPQIMKFRTNGAPKAGDESKDTVVFSRKLDGPIGEMADFSVKFTDYRSVGGVQLPYKWTQTIGGNLDETFDVTKYDLNPANIADKFKDQRVIIRMKKPETN